MAMTSIRDSTRRNAEDLLYMSREWVSLKRSVLTMIILVRQAVSVYVLLTSSKDCRIIQCTATRYSHWLTVVLLQTIASGLKFRQIIHMYSCFVAASKLSLHRAFMKWSKNKWNS